jgi:hypothetical protein
LISLTFDIDEVTASFGRGSVSWAVMLPDERFCALLQQIYILLAVFAEQGPRQRAQALLRDLLVAFQAYAIPAAFHSPQGILNLFESPVRLSAGISKHYF